MSGRRIANQDQIRRVRYVRWGRQGDESGELPITGFASPKQIINGDWEQYFPRPVKIAVSRFMVRTKYNKEKWFDLVKVKYIQELLAKNKEELRIYVVMLDHKDDGKKSL